MVLRIITFFGISAQLTLSNSLFSESSISQFDSCLCPRCYQSMDFQNSKGILSSMASELMTAASQALPGCSSSCLVRGRGQAKKLSSSQAFACGKLGGGPGRGP
eukprot:s56_g42.t1